ncbi:hypothetical protein PGT21_026312 [Puccinia graminis f. sp. tritici]|uniref:Uncharacterized protein n=1 Tax=Puccinia graminis f. sp. tritici TaxID=56615 RepID=A0A5B0N8H3_PUCGR|nr:hypothetical protein PGT21_026312 [Puccinia graminis f. sp. tritici]KAA1092232.1 hypothetical protein PGTUg99_001605 [Puccinia graminis f. sp. tritici]
MIALTTFLIAISLLAHLNICADEAKAKGVTCFKKRVTGKDCATAMQGIVYTDNAVTKDETRISVGFGNCLLEIETHGAGPAKKDDIELAILQLFSQCHELLSGETKKDAFTIDINRMGTHNPVFGRGVQLGVPYCGVKTKDDSVEKSPINQADCVKAIDRIPENPAGSKFPLAQSKKPSGEISARFGTCHVYVNAVSGLPITLGKPELQAMLQKIRNQCDKTKQNGRLVDVGGSIGKNAKIYLETSFNKR